MLVTTLVMHLPGGLESQGLFPADSVCVLFFSSKGLARENKYDINYILYVTTYSTQLGKWGLLHETANKHYYNVSLRE